MGKKKIAELNNQFLNHEGPTDVISFDYTTEFKPWQSNHGRLIGEVFVCTAVAADAAKENGLTVSRELILYIAHGVLHLSGFDDHRKEEAKLMRHAEQWLISKLNKKFNLDIFLTNKN